MAWVNLVLGSVNGNALLFFLLRTKGQEVYTTFQFLRKILFLNLGLFRISRFHIGSAWSKINLFISLKIRMKQPQIILLDFEHPIGIFEGQRELDFGYLPKKHGLGFLGRIPGFFQRNKNGGEFQSSVPCHRSNQKVQLSWLGFLW